MIDLPQGQARVILADPPWTWSAYSAKGLRKSPQRHYGCMPLDDIRSLPVKALAHPEGASCVMWATAPMLPQAIETLAAWGFTFKTAGAWAKRSSTGAKLAFGTGYIFRSAAEFFLVGTIGKPVQKARNVRNLIIAPLREHSRKPDDMYLMCEALWDGPFIELFARTQRPGWLSWGAESDKFPHQEELAA